MPKEPAMSVTANPAAASVWVTFDRHPDHYAHWRVDYSGEVATLSMDVK